MFAKGLVYSVTDYTISQLRDWDYEQLPLTQQQIDDYHRFAQRCDQKNIQILTQDDSAYHFKRRTISGSPYVMSAYGNLDLLHHSILGIVGPRLYSSYAQEVMNSLFSTLKDYNLSTISGLAEGVDMMAHTMSLDAQIPTIAVLGGGLGYYLRTGKREIIETIVAQGGLILSEFKFLQKSQKYTFPQRNRIVAGLSDVLFLPEAGKKSGSLITVDFARQMHKPIYGAPSSIFSSHSQGLLEVMQQGIVTPVVHRDQMLDQYFGKQILASTQTESESLFSAPFGDDTSEIVSLLTKQSGGLTVGEIVRLSGLPLEEVLSQLTMAELLGVIRQSNDVWKKV